MWATSTPTSPKNIHRQAVSTISNNETFALGVGNMQSSLIGKLNRTMTTLIVVSSRLSAGRLKAAFFVFPQSSYLQPRCGERRFPPAGQTKNPGRTYGSRLHVRLMQENA